MPLFTKFIYSFGANEISAAFCRMCLSLGFIFIIGKAKKQPFKISFKEAKLLFVASLGFVFTSLTLFKACNHMDSGAVTSIHFAYPVIIFIMVSIKMKKIPHVGEMEAIIMCTLAIPFLANSKSSINIYGIILALISALTYSIYSYTLENDGLKSINKNARLFYVNLLSTIILIIYSVITKENIKLDLSGREWIIAIVYSVILTLGATSLYQRAIASIGAKYTSILSTFEPITSVLIGIALLGEKITFIQVLSIIVICNCTLYLVSSNGKKHTIKPSVKKTDI
ncbi:drug/metabolite transporter (DMT)-like permease [Peptoniphilus olsenii]|uniref:Drug/metabolite transporter (DMT)-like permease n=2 Tax=Peptoniphilus olsenii TaxID=411570 RepID=A0ABV2JBT2_9FIRM